MVRSLITMALVGACLSVQAGGSAGASAQDSAAPPAQSVNAVIEWNRTLLKIVRTPVAPPATIHATRNFAILHAAMFDAVDNIAGTFEPYRVCGKWGARNASQA